MTFLHPEFLYYMLPLLLISFILLLIKKESHQHYFSKEMLAKLKVNTNVLTLRTRNILFFLVGVLLILALAEPVLKNEKVKVRSTSADILIALDISDSMLAQDVYPNRLDSAKKKALELIKKATQERVGVIAFAKNSYLVSPISFDAKTVSFLLSKLDASSISQKGTDILTMLETVASTHTNADEKYLLILSDGGEKEDFTIEIKYAKEKGIIVFVLGMGTQDGITINDEDGSLIKYANIPIVSKLNSSISELATQTGGVYIQNTTSSSDIKSMYTQILEHSQRIELISKEVQMYIALFYYPIIAAMSLLLIAFGSITKRVKHSVPISVFVLFSLLFTSTPSHASMLDFMKLGDARSSYDANDFNSSADIYEEYAKQTNNGEAYYNAGNAYYKEKRYLKALSAYSFARTEDPGLRADKLSNMGNALVQLGTKNTLERAIKHYESSLKIKEDEDTRENLEAILKALKEQKETEKKEEEKKYSQHKGDEADSGTEEADDTNNKNKNKNSANKDNSKTTKSDDTLKPNNKKKTDNGEAQKDEDESNRKGSQNNNSSPDIHKQAKELKNKDKAEVTNKSAEAKITSKGQFMSTVEKEKWFDKLDSKQNTYLYRLNEQRAKNNQRNDKPW
ncbi:MAG: Ca-activated chloride channel family protein [Sulfurimonas sp.]|jgi:Ca-activated chloride channel family protein|uniref:VWA domain-containing protein n=1 Tax=Sulfurimonas sp. TaxID=2022749 RepID=UPI0039E3E285